MTLSLGWCDKKSEAMRKRWLEDTWTLLIASKNKQTKISTSTTRANKNKEINKQTKTAFGVKANWNWIRKSVYQSDSSMKQRILIFYLWIHFARKHLKREYSKNKYSTRKYYRRSNEHYERSKVTTRVLWWHHSQSFLWHNEQSFRYRSISWYPYLCMCPRALDKMADRTGLGCE